MEQNCKVCVTGAAGNVGSLLVKKLLEKGYTVNGTLRDLTDLSKVKLLKSFHGAETRLLLFQADLYEPAAFEPAIRGCEFVFHVATPMSHSEGFESKNIQEAAVAAARRIAEFCVRSSTVRKLIYTASVAAAAPLKQDGTYKCNVDETCWSPSHLSVAYSKKGQQDYVASKRHAEQEILSYGSKEKGNGLEIVSLPCGVIGGETVSSRTPDSVWLIISAPVDLDLAFKALGFAEELLGKIPIVHLDDVCEAHIFCMENPSINGRFFCAQACVSSSEIAAYYQQNYPEFNVKAKYLERPNRENIKWDLSKLVEKGFRYRCDTKTILDNCIRCARRMGDLPL